MRVPARIDPDNQFRDLSQAEIRAQLDARQRDLQYHLEALRREATDPTTFLVGGRPIVDVLRANASRYAAYAAGGAALLVIGTVVLRRRRRRNRPEPLEMADIVRAQFARFLDEAADLMARGVPAEKALRRAAKGKTPMLYLGAPPEAEPRRSAVRDAFGSALKTALGFAAKAAVDQVTAQVSGAMRRPASPPPPGGA